jgi:hypothetical protein
MTVSEICSISCQGTFGLDGIDDVLWQTEEDFGRAATTSFADKLVLGWKQTRNGWSGDVCILSTHCGWFFFKHQWSRLL